LICDHICRNGGDEPGLTRWCALDSPVKWLEQMLGAFGQLASSGGFFIALALHPIRPAYWDLSKINSIHK
jgi:hypothetical protein